MRQTCRMTLLFVGSPLANPRSHCACEVTEGGFYQPRSARCAHESGIECGSTFFRQAKALISIFSCELCCLRLMGNRLPIAVRLPK